MKISIQKYAKALAEAVHEGDDPKKTAERMQNVLRVFVRRKQGKLIKRFPGIFKDVWLAKRGIVEVRVTLPYEPSEEEEKELAHLIGEALGKKVVLAIKADKHVLGGMKLEFGDSVVDGTVRTRLDTLKNNFINS